MESLFPFILSIAFLFLYLFICSVALVGSFTIFTRYSKSRRKREVSIPPSPPLPGVSILRPLKGLDPQLEECLESAFRQNYPQFEILLSVADDRDPAADIAKALIARYPDVTAKLIIGMEYPEFDILTLQAPRKLVRIPKSTTSYDHILLPSTIQYGFSTRTPMFLPIPCVIR
jgi:cellulose synthase/poly-beta-1,6-N-acetylglucosamine synthase-like glycosyltransferase